MEKDWIKIFSSNRAFEAEVVTGMLLDNGIEAVLLNRQSSPYGVSLPGQAELYVHISQEEAARNLVNNHNNLPTGDPNQID